MDNLLTYQWILVITTSLAFLFIAPWAKSNKDFFHGSRKDISPNFWLLTSSLVISWLFAKSITNAANLGLSFGLVGGIAYAGYYLSFIIAGIIIYQLRQSGGFRSIHHFLENRYGRAALIIFSLLIAFRLFNEIWSNTMVIGSYFGVQGSTGYYLSIITFTILTLLYSLKGGMSSSIITDLIQMIFFGFLISSILIVIVPQTEGGLNRYIGSGEWTLATGGNLLLVAILQSISYPFHDPVMTDRGFISDTKTTLKAFIWAGIIGGLGIILFSFVGIFAGINNLEGQAPVEVAKLLGTAMMLLINFIMITSAASTLDSTFSSFSKLANIDLKWSAELNISNGRWAMIIVTILGTIPIFMNPQILSATTISGTMVIGLAPIFICWKLKAPKMSFFLSIFVGLLWGLALVFELFPETWNLSEGKYASLLTVNLYGTVSCFIAFLAPYFILKKRING